MSSDSHFFYQNISVLTYKIHNFGNFFREMEELEALKEAEETALKQAEIAAEEAARGLLGDIDLLDEVSLHTNDENHIETPSTRSLSRDEKSSPEDSKTDSAGSFQNPTQPLSAAIKPNVHGAGMTESAIQRHVRILFFKFKAEGFA